MKRIAIGRAIAAAAVTGAYAATTMSAAPTNGCTVTNSYKQASLSKVGAVDDVLLDKFGKVTGLVIGVDGFLGAGEGGHLDTRCCQDRKEERQGGGLRLIGPRII